MNSLNGLLIYEVFPRTHSLSQDFAGVEADLERIRALGADYLYLMPIHPIGVEGRKGVSGSPYSIRDFRVINPDYGDEADLKRLIESAHAKGLKVMLDIVYSHTSRDSTLSVEHPEWFYRNSEGNFSNNVPEWTDIIDLDFAHRALWEYLIETLVYWAELGADAFRCDVAPLIPMEFWREARARVDAVKPMLWLAESGWMCFVKKDRDLGIAHHTDPELHQVFDMTYDADGGEYLLKYFRGEAEIKDYLHQVYIQEVLYPPNAVKMRFLECHDDPRIAARIRDRDSLKCWTAFSMLLPGAMMFYAGQEAAVDGLSRNGDGEHGAEAAEGPTDWKSGDENFHAFCRKMVILMKRIKGACSVCRVTEITRGVVKIDWEGAGASYCAILNLENRYGEIPFPHELFGIDLLSEQRVEMSGRYRLRSQPLVIQLDPNASRTAGARTGWHV